MLLEEVTTAVREVDPNQHCYLLKDFFPWTYDIRLPRDEQMALPIFILLFGMKI